eukprot:TRINITY_DN19415_c0_g1_i1.p1 TRINITY_DN19415_c0_g1~~TRINITY_DN19415_c0_g1_i1.p1  ORF type:complete len:155 (-),score=34.41 TRINITY_DN19415_c0_g1_i1:99-563(-)
MIDFPLKCLTDFDSKYILLVFYSCNFTKEARDLLLTFSRDLKDFKNLNCEIIFASSDSCFSHHAWKSAGLEANGLGLKFGEPFPPMIGDKTRHLCLAFGVLEPTTGTAVPSLFLLDSEKSILKELSVDTRPGEVLQILDGNPKNEPMEREIRYS